MNVPVVLYVYNRPEHTYRTIESLSKNINANKIDLFIFCDTNKIDGIEESIKVSKVKSIVKDDKWKDTFHCVSVREREKNFGLFRNVVEGANFIFDEYQKAIFLEDDLETSKYFYVNMCEMLEKYQDAEDIWGISGYTPLFDKLSECKEVFMLKRANSWGWATWKKNWQKVDWSNKRLNLNNEICRILDTAGKDLKYLVYQFNNKKIDSWATVWCYYGLMENKYTIYFKKTLVKNIGLDNSGTHSRTGKATNKFIVNITEQEIDEKELSDLIFNRGINNSFNKNFRVSLYSELKWKLNIYRWR